MISVKVSCRLVVGGSLCLIEVSGYEYDESVLIHRHQRNSRSLGNRSQFQLSDHLELFIAVGYSLGMPRWSTNRE